MSANKEMMLGEIASRSQLRMAFVRKAVVTVPLLLLLGIGSGRLAGSSDGNRWFDALDKPAAMPPGWVFGAGWTVFYILMGLALAEILNARGNRERMVAIALFVVQFVINLAWSPLFFAAHEVTLAFWVIVVMFVAAVATTFVFGLVRPFAAWLMVPYLAWLCFAAALNHDIDRLNPNAETLVPEARKTQIML